MPNDSGVQSGNIINQLNIVALSEDDRVKIIQDTSDLVMKRVIIRLMEALPTDQVAKANELADNPDELFNFLAGFVPNIQVVIDEETEKVKSGLTLVANEADKELNEDSKEE
ncbi:MAG: hypothetical protein WCJ29_00470 [bacterium]